MCLLPLLLERVGVRLIEHCSVPYRAMLHTLQSNAPYVTELCSVTTRAVLQSDGSNASRYLAHCFQTVSAIFSQALCNPFALAKQCLSAPKAMRFTSQNNAFQVWKQCLSWACGTFSFQTPLPSGGVGGGFCPPKNSQDPWLGPGCWEVIPSYSEFSEFTSP